MKSLKESFIKLTLLILIFCFWGINTFAFTTVENIRVGIFYGSNAKSNVKIEAKNGLYAGYYENREFKEILDTGLNSAIVRKDTEFTVNGNTVSESSDKAANFGPYHIQYYKNLSLDDALAKVNEIKSSGNFAYIAYINSQINVWGGNFINQNDAQYAANTSAFPAEVVNPSDKRLQVMNSNSLETVFMFDDNSLGLGIRPKFSNPMDEKCTVITTYPTEYRGGFDFKRLDDGNLTISNIVNLERYLYSVISKEMSPSWPKEALKAQAVCARNYALISLNKHQDKYGFDVCNTTDCQAYGGTSSETAASYPPVDETRNAVLMYNGELAQTVYSSSMGPSTESSKNVWGTDYPYLVSVDNPYEDTQNISNGVWKKELTKARATEIMNSKGYSVGDVTSIQAIEYTGAGRVLKLKVTGTAGEKIFEREACRTIFGEATLSQLYTVTGGGANASPICIVGNNSSEIRSIGDISILSSGGVSKLTGNNLYSTDGTANKVYSITEGNSDTFVFSGMGWGHGVGMSQYGAKGMAENGFSYEQILQHYYTGTTLEKAY